MASSHGGRTSRVTGPGWLMGNSHMRTSLWCPLSRACSPPSPCSSRPSSSLTSQPGTCLSPSSGCRFAGSASCLWSSQPTHRIQRGHSLGFDAITSHWLLSPLSLKVLGKHDFFWPLTLPGPPASLVLAVTLADLASSRPRIIQRTADTHVWPFWGIPCGSWVPASPKHLCIISP